MVRSGDKATVPFLGNAPAFTTYGDVALDRLLFRGIGV
jgi:hypothetical protein